MLQEVWLGDCLELLGNISDCSVDVLVTDPPYHNVKKHNWDNEQSSEENFLMWFEDFMVKLSPKMKPTCSGYVFCKPSLAPFISVIINKYFNFQSELVWKKTYPNEGSKGWKNKCNKGTLRRPYPSSERIILFSRDSYPEDIKRARVEKGLSVKELAEVLGAYGNVNNGGQVSNWESNRNFPSSKYLPKLEETLGIKLSRRKFDALSLSSYEDVVEYEIVPQRKNKHPCEKPLTLMQDLIKSITNEGDIILDCFAGSGTTLLAAKNLDRQFIGIEKEEVYYEMCLDRLK